MKRIEGHVNIPILNWVTELDDDVSIAAVEDIVFQALAQEAAEYINTHMQFTVTEVSDDKN